jgi:hypothetical protein
MKLSKIGMIMIAASLLFSTVPAFAAFPINEPSYSYTWAAPTLLPYMGIEHDTGFGVPMSTSSSPASWPVTWGPNPPYVNMTSGFTASLYINDLDANWGLWNASFTLSYNSTVIDVLGGTANITINPDWLGANTKAYAPGTINIYVENYTGYPVSYPGNHTLVATIMFTVMIQGSAPPLPFGYFDSSMLTYSNVKFFDAPSPGGNLPIPHSMKPDQQGRVDVYAVFALVLPYLKVVPASTILGPAPVIGSTFSVKIQVVNMNAFYYDIAVQFRLQYNSTILGLTSVTEGPWMTNAIWNTHGTFFHSIPYLGDPIFGDHVAVLDLLLPNGSGIYDQTIFPNTIQTAGVDPTVATVSFTVLQQNSFGLPNITTYLNLSPLWLSPDTLFVDIYADYPPSSPCQNGMVTIMSVTPVHDVAVTSVVAVVPHCSSKVGNDLWVFQGLPVYVNVTVLNKGDFDENVTVTLYYNITAREIIGTQNVILRSGQNQTIDFLWDTTSVPYCLNYTITAVATIPLDNNPADNTLACGPINVRIMGDIGGDGQVDGKDLTLVASSFASYGPDCLYTGSPPSLKWNLDADINGDNKIDGKDLTLIARHFGLSGSP